MKRSAQPAFETRVSQATNVQHKQVGASEFRIHTWFDYERNTFVVDVLSANDPVPERAKVVGAR
jgi:hypothetical protein